MNFLLIDGKLLKNQVFMAVDKLILSYIFNLKKANKKFFGTVQYLAAELGTKEELLSKRINILVDKGILERTVDGITLAVEYDDLINFQIQKQNEQLLEKLSEVLVNKFRV
jgi:hypothetical protein